MGEPDPGQRGAGSRLHGELGAVGGEGHGADFADHHRAEPVRSPSGKVIAAVSVSGPIERLSRQPGRLHAPAVIAAAERLSEVLRRTGGEG